MKGLKLLFLVIAGLITLRANSDSSIVDNLINHGHFGAFSAAATYSYLSTKKIAVQEDLVVPITASAALVAMQLKEVCKQGDVDFLEKSKSVFIEALKPFLGVVTTKLLPYVIYVLKHLNAPKELLEVCDKLDAKTINLILLTSHIIRDALNKAKLASGFSRRAPRSRRAVASASGVSLPAVDAPVVSAGWQAFAQAHGSEGIDTVVNRSTNKVDGHTIEPAAVVTVASAAASSSPDGVTAV